MTQARTRPARRGDVHAVLAGVGSTDSVPVPEGISQLEAKNPESRAERVRLIGTLESPLAHVVGLSEDGLQLQLQKARMNDGLS
jgi:hypothetical protein